MKAIAFCAATILGLLAAVGRPSLARPVESWDYDKLTAQADVVVIATAVSTEELKEASFLFNAMITQPDGSQLPMPVVGMETRFLVSACLKGKLPEVDGKPTSTISLHYYRSDSMPANGPMLLKFKPGDGAQYLMFLKRADDGRYVAVSGQTDPDFSVEQLKNRKKAE